MENKQTTFVRGLNHQVTKFKKDEIIHVFGISSFMATTTHQVWKATGIETPEGQPIVKENKKGSRKTYVIKINEPDMLVFVGDVPFVTDSERPAVDSGTGMMVTSYSGNACINLVGDIQVIKLFIEDFNLNKNFTKFDTVIHLDGKIETPVFPESDTHHSVVQRIREKLTV